MKMVKKSLARSHRFLPKSVPILKLYISYLNLVYPLDKESFDEKFPVLQIPENATADTIINLRRNKDLLLQEGLWKCSELPYN